MNKVYNTQEEIASKIIEILLKIIPDMRKTQLKIIPFIVIGMILSESVVASDISKKLKGAFSLVQHDSVVKRIKRFFTNKLFKPYEFYDKIIRYVIKNFKGRNEDGVVHIVFDHMFSHANFTVFMITMRIGKQGIPLWFRCFKGKDCSEAFAESLLKEGISYVSSLFSSEDKLVFLADRWFNSISLLDHIASLGHIYCVRMKRNLKAYYYDKKEGHNVCKTLGDLPSYLNRSNLLHDIEITDSKYKVNIAISKRKKTKEPWIIATNGNPKRAIKYYGYRFGAIECVFKNQKSNGFYLESTVNASLKYFESLYCIACFCVLFLTILGADYTKNSNCYKDVKITTQKYTKDKSRKRVLSLFNTGLTLFNLAYEAARYIRIPFTLVLYDS